MFCTLQNGTVNLIAQGPNLMNLDIADTFVVLVMKEAGQRCAADATAASVRSF